MSLLGEEEPIIKMQSKDEESITNNEELGSDFGSLPSLGV
jgi:hypothetical protein